MPQPTCRHVHANGALCKSPPLRNRDYCHFHLDQIGRQLRAARARARHLPAAPEAALAGRSLRGAGRAHADGRRHHLQRDRCPARPPADERFAPRFPQPEDARAWKQDALFVAEGDAANRVAQLRAGKRAAARTSTSTSIPSWRFLRRRKT